MTPALATPARDLDRTIAHLLATAEANAGHLVVHAAAAAAAAKAGNDPDLLAHHLRHSGGHAGGVSSHLVKARAAVARRLPAVARELDDLGQATPGNRSAPEHVPAAALAMSIAHDLASAQVAAAHVERHIEEAQSAQAAGDLVSVRFNVEHLENHVPELAFHLGELDNDLCRKLPAVRHELARLHEVMQGGAPGPAPAAPDGRALAGLRCDGCGELTGGAPCVECGLPADARGEQVQRRARDRLAAQFARGSRWGGAV